MKNFLITLLLPLFVFSQDTWVSIEFSFDNYAQEVSWSLYNATDTISVPVGYYESQQPNAYQFIELESGDYTFELIDDWGDGLSWPFDGYCLVSNECQDTLFYAEGNYGLGLIESLTIAPCAPPDPPVIDCMDTNAINYNSSADINDTSLCEYPSCNAFENMYVEQQCYDGSALLYYQWDISENPNCNVVQISYGSADGNYNFDVNIDNGIFGVYAGNGQMPPNWSEEYYFQITSADSLVSDTLFYTPFPCTQGCTDETAENYNPWANIDDGSCANVACGEGLTLITIDITLDNWPGETGWSLVSGGNGDEAPSGTYSYQDVGQTYSYDYCVMEAGFEFIISDTYGDGLAGSTTGGTLDGNVVITGCNGDTITSLSNNNWLNGNQEEVGVGFGNIAYSTWQESIICSGPEQLEGCTDPLYQEFAPWFNVDDGSCLNEHILGCVIPEAFNYDPSATQMSIQEICMYDLVLQDDAGDGWGNSFLGVTQGDYQWSFTIGPDSYEETFMLLLNTYEPVEVYYFAVGGPQTPPEEVAFQTLHNSFKLINSDGVVLMEEGSNPFANNGQGALQSFGPPLFNIYKALPYCGNYCIPTIEGCMDSEALNYCEDCNVDDGTCIEIVYGCTNDLAFNYNEEANWDDNSCIPVIVGCMDNIAWNYNEEANVEDGSCLYFGCTDAEATNYNLIANVDNGSCLYPGCTDINALNYNETANTDDGSCIPVVYGCTNEEAFNYDSSANTDNDSCIPVVEGCTNVFAFNYDSFANVDNGSCELIVYGCMDENALNYNENANIDNESCIEIVLGCTDSGALNYNENANVDDFSCIDPIYGCTDNTMFNYNELANIDNGSCIAFAYGCIDSDALNYDPIANTLDPNVPCCYVSGCMNIYALNYNQNACYDDGSCIEIIEGCMDNDAYNYNTLANVSNPDDCLYNAGCYSGPGNPYWLNDNCYAWVIDVDSYCCDENWDESCQDMYNYCEFGWPISLDDLSNQGVVVYPNPTTNILNISTRLDIKVKVINMKGKIIFNNDNIDKIDLSNYAIGVYNLIIETNDKQYIKKIIKQ